MERVKETTYIKGGEIPWNTEVFTWDKFQVEIQKYMNNWQLFHSSVDWQAQNKYKNTAPQEALNFNN